MRPAETHIRLGIRSVSRSCQSLRCPHAETVDPYLPIAISRSLSEKSRGENSRRKKWFLFFSAKHIFSRKGCSAAKREKRAFFLGWSVCQHFQTSSPLKPLGRLKPNFICSLLGTGERKFVQTVLVTWPRWPPCPYMVKNLKITFSGTKKPMTLKLGIQHWVLKYYQVCSNDDPGLTTTYFMARSNLVPYAFVWENGKTMDF